MLRRFSPWLYQGRKERTGYFEGWYFKLCQANGHSIAFIPGISLARGDRHAFIQYIDGAGGVSAYVRYPVEAFGSTDRPFAVQVGPSVFGEGGLQLAIDSPQLQARGNAGWPGFLSYPSGFLRAGIMGPFGLPGFLECYHGIVSADHALQGRVDIRLGGREQQFDFSGGRGYVEKDWGRSFPRDYVWLQANSFATPGISVFVSLAAIPFRGLDFPGLIAFVHLPGLGFVTLATWNRARVTAFAVGSGIFAVTLRRAGWALEVLACQTAAAELAAPRLGQMDRIIKESVDGVLEFRLSRHGQVLADGVSAGAGLEVGGDPRPRPRLPRIPESPEPGAAGPA